MLHGTAAGADVMAFVLPSGIRQPVVALPAAGHGLGVYGQMTDEDLKALFAYLNQIPAIRNKVQEPLLPAAAVN